MLRHSLRAQGALVAVGFLLPSLGLALFACSSGGAAPPVGSTAAAVTVDDPGKGGDAGNEKEFQPSTPLNAVMGPVAIVDGGASMFDIGQQAATKFTLDATWSPTGTGSGRSSGVLAFRASSSSDLVGYILTIDATGHPSLAVTQLGDGGKPTTTPLAGPGTALTLTPLGYSFQLVADGSHYTVTDDSADAGTALSFDDDKHVYKEDGGTWGTTYSYDADDPNAWAYVDAPATWFSSSGTGTWTAAVKQAGQGANPTLGHAAIVLPDTDEDNTYEIIDGTHQILVNHFAAAQPGSAEIDVDLTPMSTLKAKQTLGHLTLHRQDFGTDESTANDYALVVYQDHLELHKQFEGSSQQLMSVALSSIWVGTTQLFPWGLSGYDEDGGVSQLPVQFMAYDHDGVVTVNVNITDMHQTADGGGTDLDPQNNDPQVFAGGEAKINGAKFAQDETYVTLVTNVMSYTDTPPTCDAGAPDAGPDCWPNYTSGFRFGLYTADNVRNCWEDLALINH